MGSLLDKLHTIKFARLLFRSYEDKRELEEKKHLEQKQFEEEYNRFNKAIAKNPNDGLAYHRMGNFYMFERDIKEARRWFRKGIEIDPEEPNNYIGIAACSHEYRQWKDAEKWLQKGLNNSYEKGKFKICLMLAGARIKAGKCDEALEYIKIGIESNPQSREIFDFLRLPETISQCDTLSVNKLLYNMKPMNQLEISDFAHTHYLEDKKKNQRLEKNNSLINKWIEDDLRKMIRLLRENNIPVILQNYPIRKYRANTFTRAYERANSVIEKIANEMNVLLVDNQNAFFRLGPDIDQFLEPRGTAEHCNEKGYMLMAKNITETLIENKKIEYIASSGSEQK